MKEPTMTPIHESPAVDNPFALMLNPEAVFQALASSNRLDRLKRRVCRPLDTPLLGKSPRDLDAFDAGIDAADEPRESDD
jgi:hypothetical protein